MNTQQSLKTDYIDSQFERPDFDLNPLAGSIKIRGALSGETNWLNVSQEQLIAIRAVLLMNPIALAQVLSAIARAWPEVIGEFK